MAGETINNNLTGAGDGSAPTGTGGDVSPTANGNATPAPSASDAVPTAISQPTSTAEPTTTTEPTAQPTSTSGEASKTDEPPQTIIIGDIPSTSNDPATPKENSGNQVSPDSSSTTPTVENKAPEEPSVPQKDCFSCAEEKTSFFCLTDNSDASIGYCCPAGSKDKNC